VTHPPADDHADNPAASSAASPADNSAARLADDPAADPVASSADDSAELRARPIGMFDSGIGGLTVLHECLVAMPAEDFVYVGDTARFPYGPRTQDELRLFARQIATFLDDTGVKLLVVACYSATAAALPALQEQFSTPIVGVVLPGARAAVQTSRYRRIGVLATEATVASGSYVRAIGALDGGAEVIQQACPGLAAFIQDGDVASHEIVAAVRRFTAPLKEQRPDVVIMGCTHYPLIAPLLQRHLGRDVTLVNPAAEIAREVAEVLVRQAIDNDAEREGSYRFFCTGDVDAFRAVGARFLQMPLDDVQQVGLDRLAALVDRDHTSARPR
jgi:glutamate racemase